MAKLKAGINFLGTLAGVTAYTRKDLDDIILRTKGGPTRKQIRQGKQFESVRKNNMEFGGRAVASKYILQAMHPVKSLVDYNLAGPLNRLLKPIQEADEDNEKGKRSIRISKLPWMLEGFSLNRRNLLESVVGGHINCVISSENRSATVELPALIPRINFFPVEKYPVYRWHVLLGMIPDLVYSEEKKTYLPHANFEAYSPSIFQSDWHPVNMAQSPVTIVLELKDVAPDDLEFSLMVVAGIGFGTVRSAGYEQVNYAGAGRILKVINGNE